MPKSSSFEIPFEAIFNAAPDAIVVVDDTGKIVLVNHQTEALFGYNKQELVDQSFRQHAISRLKRLVPHLGLLDLVVISGDLTTKGRETGLGSLMACILT